ncbi:beta-hydroxyacyl-ACP dehydratase [Acidihalobacter prosperus]|uniref:3-hydroxyacyl-[acyl-carrier-protein] dehydratase FabZ n=1 Tax=Acidihalobacter prosperus TaxID=160660 RepID=A0A1A6C908_9GAMM|nr:beta-hydroxyacyl-ACP dehydratase [Acidihalobacter prosperus]
MESFEARTLNSFNIQEILNYLPHRYPFLLVDKVVDCVPGEWLTAVKNVTVNEPFFQGHFPNRPVMPGVLILEAMAQATGLLAFKTRGDAPPPENFLYLFVSVDRARFKRQIIPGDQLIMRVELLRVKRDMWKFSAEARVDGDLAAEAELMCAGREVVS